MSFLAIVLTGAGVLVALIGRVIVGLITAEAVATVPHVSRTLVRRAAEQLPSEHRDRFAEEWEAHVEDFGERRLAGLKWAIGLSLGARELVAELAPAPQPERAGAQAESPPEDSVVKEGPLKGWRKVGQVPIGPPVISTPEGDLIVPVKRWRSAVGRRFAALLGFVGGRLRQLGTDLRFFSFNSIMVAMRQCSVLARDALAVARTSAQVAVELWRSQGQIVRMLAAQLVRSVQAPPLVPSLAAVTGGLTVALLLLALLGAQ